MALFIQNFSRRVMGSTTSSPEASLSAVPITSPTSSCVSTSPSVISQISAESATQVTTIVGNLHPVGRGMVAKMRSLEVSSATVKEVIKPVAQEKPKVQPKSEELYPKPILAHQENAPIIRKGEMGTK
jgi:hypothetical protein